MYTYLYWYQYSMVATNIAEQDEMRAADMRQVNFRMPPELHDQLITHLFNTGRRKFQSFALEAVVEKFSAEQKRARRSGRNA